MNFKLIIKTFTQSKSKPYTLYVESNYNKKSVCPSCLCTLDIEKIHMYLWSFIYCYGWVKKLFYISVTIVINLVLFWIVIKSHSFRKGAATIAFSNGVPEQNIKSNGKVLSSKSTFEFQL